MENVAKFSLLVFAPVLMAFLLPASLLLPVGGLIILGAIFDPAVSFTGALSYNLWVIGPVTTACGLSLIRIWRYSFYRCARSIRSAWTVIWSVFTIALIITIWFGVSVLTSIGASDKPLSIFPSWTALLTVLLTLLAQMLAIPWLYAVSRMLHTLQSTQTMATN